MAEYRTHAAEAAKRGWTDKTETYRFEGDVVERVALKKRPGARPTANLHEVWERRRVEGADGRCYSPGGPGA
jgi:hypothetical protein